MSRHAYRLDMPDHRSTPVIVASPHSGRHYPWSFTRRTVLDERAIRSSEDAFMDMLVADAPRLGAPLLAAEFPRAYVDLNRNADELDPGVVAGVKRASQNPRISSGLGVIPRVVANGRVIYRGKLSLDEAEARISQVWRPYHRQLEELVSGAQVMFGRSILLDFHSMPHEALDAISRPGQRRPEVVLGDRFGASCNSAVVEQIEAAFEEAGLVVSRNAPFAGAFVTQHYGRPSRGRHAVQIEIDRSLYMNERLIRPNGNFQNVKALITEVLDRVIGPRAGQVPLAAE
ncbi:N-formylglutamate amidohydrolase [Rhodophyticola porphyridii]|uniref:N-formylglutamate amidohydrolase n=1 Tax=Rhodophyticola porphyridii TaxID=1852017 RepID=A0A3L9YI88_9RHOB|nr:N-formylglutamate amidohydrolase [Rhodophyticola porphyridii]RMA42540.1 N-formylglutamate amidohydrolase [Rhodophyticola porphyridii]